MSRNVSNWIEGFLGFTSNTEPCEMYRRWAAISTISSALQRKCRLEWGVETFYPNMYIVLVGPPAARKGTAMKTGKLFLDKLGIASAADETSRQKLIKSLMEATAISQDSNGGLTAHSSLTIFSSELTVFIGYESKELLSSLCKLYDCEERYVYDTVSRGKEEVPNVWLTLLGATTPGQLQASVPEGFVGSGFTSRVVFVYAENKGKVVIKPTITDEQRALRDMLIEDLSQIHALAGDFHTTPAFDELYAGWRTRSESRRVFQDVRLEYYAQRRPTHLFKLSMIYSAARSNSMEITDDDLAESIATLEEAEKNMPKVFKGIGTNPLVGIQSRLMNMLEKRKSIPMTEVAQEFFSEATHSQLGEAINSLEQMGYCSIDVVNKKLIFKGA